MEMPTLEDIFYEMHFGKATSNMLEDEENSLRGYLEKLIEKKKIDNSAAERIIDTETDICLYAKCTGFEQGFRFAVRLLCFRD